MIIPWFGAGISILSPSCLPPGIALTYKWLEYLTNKEDADYIKTFFNRFSKYLEKNCPRLERIIEDAVKIYGVEVLTLLQFFEHAEPNSNHFSIARYFIKYKSWGITTNFDSGVENALNTRIPVHTPSSLSPENWGILKIHGSINEDLSNLGHSIGNLMSGIQKDLSVKIRMLMNDEQNLFVFAGYSGSDSFDVTPFFAQFMDNPAKASAIWIDHRNSNPGKITKNELAWGPRTILNAFSKSEVVRGRTEELLCDILGNTPGKPLDTSPKVKWDNGWEDRFPPPPKNLRNIFAAQLFASFGMGIRSLQAINRNLQKNTDLSWRERQLLLNAVRDSGCSQMEIRLRKTLKPKRLETNRDWEELRKLSASYRLAKKSIKALSLYRKLIKAAKKPSDEPEIAYEQCWAITEAALFARDFLMRITDNSFYRVLFYPFRAYLVGKIKHLYDYTNIHYRSAMSNPHIIATLERVLNAVTTCGSSPSTGYYKQILGEHLILEKSESALEHALHSGAIYNETDSILGMVNNFRDQGR